MLDTATEAAAAGSTHAETANLFVTNAWYVIAAKDEVSREPIEKWVLDRPIVLYRTERGEPVALEGACPHRQMPLARGRLIGNELECSYHGLAFDGAGRCIRIPGQSKIPASFRVQRYATMERGPWIWVWMGNPAQADAADIPADWLTDPEWVSVNGMKHIRCRAQLLVENLMDLSHEAFVHPESIGNSAVAETPVTTTVDGDVVRAKRWMDQVSPAPLFVRFGMKNPVDRQQNIEFHPATFIILHNQLTDVEKTIRFKIVNAITPERSNSVRYYWAAVWDFLKDDQSISDLWERGADRIFDQDVIVLQEQERMLVEGAGQVELTVEADSAAVQTRRVLKRLVEKEAQTR